MKQLQCLLKSVSILYPLYCLFLHKNWFQWTGLQLLNMFRVLCWKKMRSLLSVYIFKARIEKLHYFLKQSPTQSLLFLWNLSTTNTYLFLHRIALLIKNIFTHWHPFFALCINIPAIKILAPSSEEKLAVWLLKTNHFELTAWYIYLHYYCNYYEKIIIIQWFMQMSLLYENKNQLQLKIS